MICGYFHNKSFSVKSKVQASISDLHGAVHGSITQSFASQDKTFLSFQYQVQGITYLLAFEVC